MTDLLATVRDVLCAAIDGLSADVNCYVSAVTFDLPGEHPFYVQVVDNGSQIGEDQGGNVLARRVSVKISAFVHMDLDQPGRSSEALINGSLGLRNRVTAIREALRMNTLGGALTVPLLEQQTMPPVAYPAEPLWVSQDVIFAGVVYARVVEEES